MASDLAVTLAALILADADIEITSDKIIALTSAANVDIEPIWASLLSKVLEGKNVKELLVNIGSGGGGPGVGVAVDAEVVEVAAKDEKIDVKVDDIDSDSDDDIFGLFDSD